MGPSSALGGVTPAPSKLSTQPVPLSVFAEQGMHVPVSTSEYFPAGHTWFTTIASMLIELPAVGPINV